MEYNPSHLFFYIKFIKKPKIDIQKRKKKKMSEIAYKDTLFNPYHKIKNFFDQFPLVTHERTTTSVKTHSNVESFYDDLRLYFDANDIFPLRIQDGKTENVSKTLFLSALNLSSQQNTYHACTPEDTVSLNEFLNKNNLKPPMASLKNVSDYDDLTTSCIVIMDVNTLQIPLIIDNSTGYAIQDDNDYTNTEETHDEEKLKEYQSKSELDINDKESVIKAYRSYSIILYLIILMNVPDLEKRLHYFNSINERYLVKHNIFGLLSINKCVSLTKIIQLHMSRKGTFMMEMSLKLWDGLNYIFKKTDDLNKEVEIIKLKYSNYKTLSKEHKDEVVSSVIECINNDDILKEICNDISIDF